MRDAAVRFTDERCPPRTAAAREAIEAEDQEDSSSVSNLKDAARDGQTTSLSSSECTSFCAAAHKDENEQRHQQQQQYDVSSRQFGSSQVISSGDSVMQAAPHHHHQHAEGLGVASGCSNGGDDNAEVNVAVKFSEKDEEGDGSRHDNENDQKMAAVPIAEHHKALHLLDGPLFGREEEGRQLLAAYERCLRCCCIGGGGSGSLDATSPSTNNDPIQPEIVLLTGASGTGKVSKILLHE
jgi:hypothetical protein